MSESLPDRAEPETGGPETAGVIVRPPLLYLAHLALGVALDLIWPVDGVLGGWVQYPVGFLVAALGGVLVAAGMGRFRAAGTPVETRKPTEALVTEGVYGRSRNPIYLGLMLIYVGIGVALDSLWVLALLLPLLFIMRLGVIGREERYLEQRFGEAYARYRDSVRRWI